MKRVQRCHFLLSCLSLLVTGLGSPAEGLPLSSSSVTTESVTAAATTTTTASTTTFLVCAVDGSVSVVDATTGNIKGLFSTGRPLVGASAPHAVVPGLDGRLYQYMHTNAFSQHKDDEEDEDDEDEDEEKESPHLHVLPMTVEDVVLHPVRTCERASSAQDDEQSKDESKYQNCGIVTGTKLTHLYAWNPVTGHLEWTQQPPLSSDPKAQPPPKQQCDATPILILQREDFVVRHISTLTGNEVWNVTLGRFAALDFDPYTNAAAAAAADTRSTVRGYLPGRNGNTKRSRTNAGDHDDGSTRQHSVLPLVAFSRDGKTLTAIDGKEKSILWRRQWHAVVASVYGVAGQTWMPTIVVDEPPELEHEIYSKETEDDDDDDGQSKALTLSTSMVERNEKYQVYLDNLWQEMQRLAGMALSPYDIVVYPHSHPDMSYLLESMSLSARKNWEGCMPDASGVCTRTRTRRPQLLIGSGQENLAQQMQPQGLLLSWNVVAGLVVLMMTAAVCLRILYLRKKKQWMSLQPTLRMDRLSASWHAASLDPRPRRFQNASFGQSPGMARSLSLPVFEGDDGSRWHSHAEKLLMQRKSVTGAASAEMTDQTRKSPMSSSDESKAVQLPSVGHIDGIPLVRYSRYKSEFRELSPLGRGGFGSVFRCVNALDGREYAIKKIHIQSELDADGAVTKEFSQHLQRVLREVKILARLEHPNIVRYYTAWLELEEDGSGASRSTDYLHKSESVTMDSKMSRCLSSELLLEPVDGRRPSFSGMGGRTSSNPLGWGEFRPDFDDSIRNDVRIYEDDDSDFGFTFERSESPTVCVDTPASDYGACLSDHLADKEACQSSMHDSRDTHTHTQHTHTHQLSRQEDSSPSSTENRKHHHSKQQAQSEPAHRKPKSSQKVCHTLYIQMQLCSQNTLGDFISDPQFFQGTALASTSQDTIDIPCALRLFYQIAQAVRHVHQQGLIHRDLKPSNCFVDGDVVKVGDFGLSRESSSSAGGVEQETSQQGLFSSVDGGMDDNTAGVGTRSYASPEQMKGSDYDASTDVYSLGIMLFELCYPMSTGMERQIVFSKLRQLKFPEEWLSGVATSFPTVHSLLLHMLSHRPSDRPSAETVARQLESLLGEFTITSLDHKRQEGADDASSVWLRVEAAADSKILARTISLIQSAAPGVSVLQYGLRGKGDGANAIMEFSVSVSKEHPEQSLQSILEKLRGTEEIEVVRQVSHRGRYNF